MYAPHVSNTIQNGKNIQTNKKHNKAQTNTK